MERVAFLVEQTGERISCMLNPESLVLRRWAGVEPLRSAGGTLAGSVAEDPLLYTGGGRTELCLDLLFDISIEGSSIQSDDIRDLTSPLWRLTETVVGEDDIVRPPLVRFVWGKAWNLCVVIMEIAERLERFSPGGKPERSWIRVRLRRVAEPGPTPALPAPSFDVLDQLEPDLLPEGARVHQVVGGAPAGPDAEGDTGERLDEIAYRYYGNAAFWKVLAQANGLENPLQLQLGQPLVIPTLKSLRSTP